MSKKSSVEANMQTKPKIEEWQPSQNRFLGMILAVIGFITFVTSVVPALIAQGGGEDENILMLLGLVMFFGGAVLMTYAKRHLTRRGEDVLAKDKRQPIIYLRSFDDQSNDFTIKGFFASVRLMFTQRNLGMAVSIWGPTFQTQLALIMNRIGPYIAVGRPGVCLPGTGAARLYLRDDTWQNDVLELVRKARLVVIRAGTSEGLSWELNNVIKNMIEPQQLLVILPVTKKGYRDFCAIMTRYEISLPYKPPKTILMTFARNWQPIFLEGKGKLEDILTPYFQSNKIITPNSSSLDALRLFFT